MTIALGDMLEVLKKQGKLTRSWHNGLGWWTFLQAREA